MTTDDILELIENVHKQAIAQMRESRRIADEQTHLSAYSEGGAAVLQDLAGVILERQKTEAATPSHSGAPKNGMTPEQLMDAINHGKPISKENVVEMPTAGPEPPK
jgi:hypothetical protein